MLAHATELRKSENTKKFRNYFRVFDRVPADGAAAHQTGRNDALIHRGGQAFKRNYGRVVMATINRKV